MYIEFEKEVCEYLNIPSIPLKEHDGKTSFKDGVAVVELKGGTKAYAVATFDADNDAEPRIKKVFSVEQFNNIERILVVPSYMDMNIQNADLDNESKVAAQRLADEVSEMENEGVESELSKEMNALPEWVFDEIHNKEEAEAWLRRYNTRNKIRGKLPKTEENIKLRLLAIYTEKKEKK